MNVKTTSYALSECLSHPKNERSKIEGQALTTHLLEVSEFISSNFNFILNNKHSEALRRCAIYTGLMHDIAKSTKFFQDYLQGKDANFEPEYRYHSQLSALLSLLGENIYDGLDLSEEELIYYRYISLFAIYRHHGNLRDTNDMSLDLCPPLDVKNNLKIYQKQIDSMPDISEICDWLQLQLKQFKIPGYWFSEDSKKASKESLKMAVGKIVKNKKLHRLWKTAKSFQGTKESFDFMMVFSYLIGHDKIQAAMRKNVFSDLGELGIHVVDTYKSLKFSTPTKSKIDMLRNSCFETVVNNLNKYIDSHIFTLTAPTGIGKTLMVIHVALVLAHRKKARYPHNCIIYGLPFTSIIDQNHKVIQEVLEANHLVADNDLLLKHHYLSSEDYNTKKNFQNLENSSNLLIEEWASALIVTTYVQLFNTFVSCKNANLKRLHRLRGSVIILDEIQALPRKYYAFLRDIFLYISEEWDIDIIIMTATCPLIFEKGEYVELTGNPATFFEQLDRIKIYNYAREACHIEQFISTVSQQAIEQPTKSIGCVVNTVDCAKRIFIGLKKTLPHKEIIFLSSQITSQDKLDRIDRIKKANEVGEPIILVSTQAIEAGVDISLDIIHRDLCPYDSLQQTGGRANRSGITALGEVYLWRLQGFNSIGELYEYHSCIYDPVLIDCTQKLLEHRDVISEPEFYDIGQEYYHMVRRRTDFDDVVRSAMQCFYFETMNNEFQLMQQLPKQTFFVLKNAEAKKIWGYYVELRNKVKDEDLSFNEFKSRFKKIKKDFYSYIINAKLKNQDNKEEDEIKPLYLVDESEGKSYYYHPDFGFDEK